MAKVQFNGDEWIPVNKGDEGIYLDGFLKEKLDKIKQIQKKNWDCVFIISGMEGSGKSTLSFICGQYLSDNSLTINNLAEGSTSAIRQLESLPEGSVLILDEAELAFASKDSMKKEQRQLIHILMTIRQKNMILILVTPSFFDLNKYIAVSRSRFLLRTYTDEKLNRGFFTYYGERRKRILYYEGKKSYGSYSKPKPNFYGRFTDYKLPFDKEYQVMKKKSLSEAFEINKLSTNTGGKLLWETETILNIKKVLPKISNETIGKIFGVGESTIRRRIQQHEIRISKSLAHTNKTYPKDTPSIDDEEDLNE